MPTTKINWSDAGQENEHLCRAGWPGGQGTLHYSCSVRARQTGWQRPDRSRADPFGGDKCQTSPISLRLPVGPSFPPCLWKLVWTWRQGNAAVVACRVCWHSGKKEEEEKRKQPGSPYFVYKSAFLQIRRSQWAHQGNSQSSSTVVKSLAR